MDASKQQYLLVVEDDPDLRGALRDVLSQAIPAILLASNGKEALELSRTHNIATLVTDVHMGQHGGFELVRNFRAEGGKAPVIFMSGDEVPNLSLGASVLEPCQFISKPFANKLLLALVIKTYYASLQRFTPTAS